MSVRVRAKVLLEVWAVLPGVILLALSHLVASSSTEQFKCCLPPKRQSQLSDD